MTRAELISRTPAELFNHCMAIDSALTIKAADGCVNLANDTGWLAISDEEAVETFTTACLEFAHRAV